MSGSDLPGSSRKSTVVRHLQHCRQNIMKEKKPTVAGTSTKDVKKKIAPLGPAEESKADAKKKAGSIEPAPKKK
ncbi:MAG: hypothetical protein JWP27_655 [Flaviaesturariibacter sp.]|nr:hypothetical protein [Flaviaesturariibacter sp.]